MFYCGACAKANSWPATISTSYGPCEVCGTTARCHERPSRLLPEPVPGAPAPVTPRAPLDGPGNEDASQ